MEPRQFFGVFLISYGVGLMVGGVIMTRKGRQQ